MNTNPLKPGDQVRIISKHINWTNGRVYTPDPINAEMSSNAIQMVDGVVVSTNIRQTTKKIPVSRWQPDATRTMVSHYATIKTRVGHFDVLCCGAAGNLNVWVAKKVGSSWIPLNALP